MKQGRKLASLGLKQTSDLPNARDHLSFVRAEALSAHTMQTQSEVCSLGFHFPY